MNRNRNSAAPATVAKPSSQSFVSSISSSVSHMATATTNDDDNYASQSLNTTATDVQSLLESFKVNSNRDSKRVRTVCQPKGTTPYTVGNNDTLEKVALRFNSTPSELLQLNKLNTRIVFPGQILYVPDNSSSDMRPSSSSSPPPPPPPPQAAISPPSSTKHKDGDAFVLLSDRRISNESLGSQQQQDVGPMVWSMARQTAPRPGRAQRLSSETSLEAHSPKTVEERLKTQKDDNRNELKHIQKTLSQDENSALDAECLQRFIKVNVRLMTENHSSVSGTLLVTPNAVMFDPDVLDPLVKEHGIEKYGLIIRMDALAGIALYEDIAIYEHETTSRDDGKRKLCHSTSIKSLHHSSSIHIDDQLIGELMTSMLDRIDKVQTSSDEYRMLFNAAASTSPTRLFSSASSTSSDPKFKSLPLSTADSDNLIETSTNETIVDNSFYLASDIFQPSEEYKHSIGVLMNNDDDTKDNFNAIPPQECHLENCVPLDELNKRFGEIDQLLHKQQQIYIDPHIIEIPYYLCIKTSTFTNDIPSLQPRPHYTNKRDLNTGYGKKPLENEYWFSVPKEKIDHLYAFFLRWNPERAADPLGGDDLSPRNDSFLGGDRSSSKHDEIPPTKGFVLLATDDPELSDDYRSTNKNDNSTRSTTTTSLSPDDGQRKQPHYLRRQNTLLKEWEIISVDEIYRRINSSTITGAHHHEAGIPPPKLLQPSTLINEDQSKQILLELPARVHGLDWLMTFSTDKNGFSLSQLYRRSLEQDHDAPSLLIVKDVEQNIFGAYVSQQLMISEGFYGTGESFLFTFHPEFRVFNWSGHNQFFVKGDVHSLGIGSGEGTYGLWMDADLYRGRTCPSKTFNNPRLSSKEDFIIASVEVWTFID